MYPLHVNHQEWMRMVPVLMTHAPCCDKEIQGSEPRKALEQGWYLNGMSRLWAKRCTQNTDPQGVWALMQLKNESCVVCQNGM